MKKISILVMLILCVTIGGVYAAWTYSDANLSSSVDTTISHGMASITSVEVGDLKIVSNSLLVKVDQADEQYHAGLVVTGQITVSFVPGPGADDDVYVQGIPVYASVYVANAEANLYQGSPIYVTTGEKIRVEWEKQEDGSFLGTLQGDQVEDLFELGADFVLANVTEYNAFHALEGKLTLNIKFEQGEETGATE